MVHRFCIFTAQPLLITCTYMGFLVFPFIPSSQGTAWKSWVCLMIFWHRHNQDCDERLCSHLKHSWIVIVLYWSYQTKVPRIGAKTWFVSFQILFVFRDWKTDIFDKQRALKFKAKQEEEKGLPADPVNISPKVLAGICVSNWWAFQTALNQLFPPTEKKGIHLITTLMTE